MSVDKIIPNSSIYQCISSMSLCYKNVRVFNVGWLKTALRGTKQDNSTDVQETWLKVQVWPSHSKLNLFLTNWMSISSPLYSLDSLETSSNQWNHIKTTFQHAAALIVLDPWHLYLVDCRCFLCVWRANDHKFLNPHTKALIMWKNILLKPYYIPIKPEVTFPFFRTIPSSLKIV